MNPNSCDIVAQIGKFSFYCNVYTVYYNSGYKKIYLPFFLYLIISEV